MKAILLSTGALVAACWSGTLTVGGLATGDAAYFWADGLCVLLAFLLQLKALQSARAAQARTMFRDLRSTDALLDEIEDLAAHPFARTMEELQHG